MTIYLPRSAWTNTARGGARLTAGDLEGLAVHYPGRAAPYGVLTRRQEAAILRGIRNYHVGTNGWSDFGYQVAISQAGRVWDCRGISRVPAAHASAANPRANWRWGAVLLLVGNTERPRPAMVEAFTHFRREVWLPRWPGTTDVRGHRQVPGASTSCPGDVVIGLIHDGTLTGHPGAGRPADPSEGEDMLPIRRVDTFTEATRSEDVELYQLRLRDLGYYKGKIDGWYGPKMAAAVLAARKAVGSSAESGDVISAHAAWQIERQLGGGGGERGPRGPQGPQGEPGEPGRTPTRVAIRGDVVDYEDG